VQSRPTVVAREVRMRVAALYDIHANLPAVEAVLADVDRAGVDLVLVGGDFAWGPLPRGTLDRLMSLEDRVRFIRGNADREVATRADDPELGERMASINRWCYDQLTGQQIEFLAGLTDRAVIEIDELGPTLFCHGSPRSDEEPITLGTSDTLLQAMLADVAQTVVVCGHTHAQFDRTVGTKRVVNPGSVGLPFGAPRSTYWALFGPGVELRRTDYDVTAAEARFRASGVPHAEWFVKQILSPPPERVAVERFTRG